MAEPIEVPGVRGYLVAELAPLLPADWRLIPAQTIPDQIDRTTVVVKHGRMTKLPEAPIGNLQHSIVLTIAHPSANIGAAEDALDHAVIELTTALDGHDRIDWTDAEKVSVESKWLGWDVTLTVITQKPTTTTTPEGSPE